MNRLVSSLLGWFGWGGALGEQSGRQVSGASGSLIPGTHALAPDGALQLSTVWACVSLIANVIASLPLFVYTQKKGERELARDALLWQSAARFAKLAHDANGVLGSHAAQLAIARKRLRSD